MVVNTMLIASIRKVFSIVYLCTAISVFAQTKNGEWRSYGGDIANTRYSPITSGRAVIQELSALADSKVLAYAQPLLCASCDPLSCEHGGSREESLATGPFVLVIIHEFECSLP